MLGRVTFEVYEILVTIWSHVEQLWEAIEDIEERLERLEQVK